MDTSGGLPSASPTTLPATVTVENDFAPDMGTLRPETLLVLLTVHRYRDQGVGDGNWGAGDDMVGGNNPLADCRSAFPDPPKL